MYRTMFWSLFYIYQMQLYHAWWKTGDMFQLLLQLFIILFLYLQGIFLRFNSCRLGCFSLYIDFKMKTCWRIVSIYFGNRSRGGNNQAESGESNWEYRSLEDWGEFHIMFMRIEDGGEHQFGLEILYIVEKKTFREIFTDTELNSWNISWNPWVMYPGGRVDLKEKGTLFNYLHFNKVVYNQYFATGSGLLSEHWTPTFLTQLQDTDVRTHSFPAHFSVPQGNISKPPAPRWRGLVETASYEYLPNQWLNVL